MRSKCDIAAGALQEAPSGERGLVQRRFQMAPLESRMRAPQNSWERACKVPTIFTASTRDSPAFLRKRGRNPSFGGKGRSSAAGGTTFELPVSWSARHHCPPFPRAFCCSGAATVRKTDHSTQFYCSIRQHARVRNRPRSPESLDLEATPCHRPTLLRPKNSSGTLLLARPHFKFPSY